MAQNVTIKDPKSYESLLNLKGEELLAKVKSHDINVASNEREKFINFAKMNPEQRQTFVGSLTQAPVSANPDKPDAAASGTPAPAHTDDKGVPPVTPSGTKPDAGNEYNDLVEITKLQENLKKQRTTNSQLGQKVKALTQELTEIQTKLVEAEKTKNPPAQSVSAPDVPEMPDPDRFVEGLYDDGYKAAMSKYKSDIKEYNTKFVRYVKSVKPDWVKDIEQELGTVKKKADDAFEYTAESRSERNQSEYKNAWDALWQEVGKIQQTAGLETPVPIDIINTNQIILNDPKSHTPEEVANADRIIKSLPKEVYEKYQKITKVVTNLYDFDANGRPVRKFSDLDDDLAWQAAIRKAGLGAEIKALKPVNLSPAEMSQRLANKQQNDNMAAAPMPSSSIGASEDPLNQATTTDEKKRKLLEMAQRLKENPRLYNDKAFLLDYDKARSEMGLARKS